LRRGLFVTQEATGLAPQALDGEKRPGGVNLCILSSGRQVMGGKNPTPKEKKKPKKAKTAKA
jgi:hypothetical protein